MLPNSKTCIYCDSFKDESKFSKEHIIPQCLGGAYAPTEFTTNYVCKSCNNDLGQFVDASFEKNWLVSNWLSMAARSLYDGSRDEGVPLICMGIRELDPPERKHGEICELWLGPHGEQIYWIRPHDESLYWYAGGNPRTTKSFPTRAYFILSQKSGLDPKLTFLSFRDSFRKRKVKKVMCTEVAGLDCKAFGFSVPDDLDKSRMDYFMEIAKQESHQGSIAFFADYDFRFMCKLAFGIGYSILGENYLKSDYAEELKKGMWHKKGEEQPNIYGTSNWENRDSTLCKVTGLKNHVTLHIIQDNKTLTLILNLGTEHSWQIKCADIPENTKTRLNGLLIKGETIILQKYRKTCRQLSFEDFIQEKNLQHEGGST